MRKTLFGVVLGSAMAAGGPAVATTIDMSPLDARLLADGTAMVVDGADAVVRRAVADGRLLARFEATARPLTWFGVRLVVALQADERGLVVLCGDGALGAWDMDGRARWWSDGAGHGLGEAARLAADGKTLATAGGWDGWVEARDPADGRLLRRWQEGTLVFDASAGPGGRQVAWVGLGEVVRVGDVATGAVRTLGPGRWPLAFAPDGRAVVAAPSQRGETDAAGRQRIDRNLVAIDVATGARRVLAIEGRPIRALPDGRLLVAGTDADGAAVGHALDVATGRARPLYRLARPALERVLDRSRADQQGFDHMRFAGQVRRLDVDTARGVGLATSYRGTSYLVDLADGKVRQRWRPSWPVDPPLVSWSNAGSPWPFWLALAVFLGAFGGLSLREHRLRRRLAAIRPGLDRLGWRDAFVAAPLVAVLLALAWGLWRFPPMGAAMLWFGLPLAVLAMVALGNNRLAGRLRVQARLANTGPDLASGDLPIVS